MRKKRRGKNRRIPLVDSRSPFFFRLCHRCFHLNESPNEIKQCAKCEYHFAPLESEESAYEEARAYLEQDDPVIEAIADFEDAEVKADGQANHEDEDEENDDEGLVDQEQEEALRIAGLNVIW